MSRNKIMDAFYDAMPDDLTLEACANGVIVCFEYENKNYSVNTAAGYAFRTRSISEYYEQLENRVLNTINEGGK